MKFSEAEVADILRCVQRDELFVNELQNNIHGILRHFSKRKYNTTQRAVPAISNFWYYFMTTLGNLQTIGEEYTGILRFDEENKVPSKSSQLLWLLFYIGGEPLYDRFLHSAQKKLLHSHELTEPAKQFLTSAVTFLQQNKNTFKRVHHFLFYVFGRYYHISNRLMGIKYVLVREWLRDETFNLSFKWLGHLSLFYAIFSLVQQMWNLKRNDDVSKNLEVVTQSSNKICALCTEIRKNPCATPCGHIFCWDCICDNLLYQKTCPICREVVQSSRLMLLQNYM